MGMQEKVVMIKSLVLMELSIQKCQSISSWENIILLGLSLYNWISEEISVSIAW